MFTDGEKVEYRVLSKSENSLLVEWSVEAGDRSMYSWMRCINGENGISILQYSKNNVEDIDEARSIWIPFLQDFTL